MKFHPTEIPDVILIEPQVFGDGRGYFFECYHRELFAKNGIRADFVQDNESLSAKGVLRGLHYQVAPREQAKLVRVTAGAAFDVVLDIRKNSPTYGRVVRQVLSAENKRMLFVPAGFAHGFCALEDGTKFLYKVTDVYDPALERGILWNDTALAIPWPKLDVPYVISEKDKKHPVFKP